MLKSIIKKISRIPVVWINQAFFTLYFSALKPKPQKLIIAHKKVILLVPHQDDEILGCGCLIQQMIENGCSVKCIFMTDGSGSLSHEYDKNQLIEVREREACEAAAYLGMDVPDFLRYPDGHLNVSDEAAKRLANIIDLYMPDVVLLPYFLDGHRDHTVVSGIYLKSINFIQSHCIPELYAYEINSPISAWGISHYIDCTGYMEKKIKALKIYKSQTMSFESLILINKLNKRLIGIQGEGVELYKKLEVELYKNIYEKYNSSNSISQNFSQMYSIYFMIPAYFKGMKLKKEIAAALQSKFYLGEEDRNLC